MQELLDPKHFQALVVFSGMKPFQTERFRRQLREDYFGHSVEKAQDALGDLKKGPIMPSSPTRQRPFKVIFIRHGESEANINREITQIVPDHDLHLTQRGREQALEAGTQLKEVVGSGAVKFVVSPYVRARETLNGIVHSMGLHNLKFKAGSNNRIESRGKAEEHTVLSDVRIREQEYGNFDRDDMQELHEEKCTFGAFYYRFPDGESPADCYDRASIFLENLYRSWEDSAFENIVVVSHGLMILVMLMRILRFPVDMFDELASLDNCEFVVLERAMNEAEMQVSYTWREDEEKDYRGLRRKEPSRPVTAIWNGDPEAETLTSEPAPQSVLSSFAKRLHPDPLGPKFPRHRNISRIRAQSSDMEIFERSMELTALDEM